MERFTPDEPIFDRVNLFQAPEKIQRVVKFIYDHLGGDVPHVIELEDRE